MKKRRKNLYLTLLGITYFLLVAGGCSRKIKLVAKLNNKFFLEVKIEGARGKLRWKLDSIDQGGYKVASIDVTSYMKKKGSGDSKTYVLYFLDIPDRYNTEGWIRDLSRNYLIRLSVKDSSGESFSTNWMELNVFRKRFVITNRKLTFCKVGSSNRAEIFWVYFKKNSKKWFLNKSTLNNYLVASPLTKPSLPEKSPVYSSFREISTPFCTLQYGPLFFEMAKSGKWVMKKYDGENVKDTSVNFVFKPLRLLLVDINGDGQNEIIASSSNYRENKGILAIYSTREKRVIFSLIGERSGDELGYLTYYCNNHLLVSAPGYNNSSGIVYVLKNGIKREVVLTPEGKGGRFGQSLVCFEDSNEIVYMIGAPFEDNGNGGNYFFSSSWVLKAHFTSHDNAHLGWSNIYFNHTFSPTGKFLIFSAPYFPAKRGKLKITDGISSPKTLIDGPDGWFIGKSVSAYDLNNNGIPEIVIKGKKGYVLLF